MGLSCVVLCPFSRTHAYAEPVGHLWVGACVAAYWIHGRCGELVIGPVWQLGMTGHDP